MLEKTQRRKTKKKNLKIPGNVFLWVGGKSGFIQAWPFLEKCNKKNTCVWKGERGIFVNTPCFFFAKLHVLLSWASPSTRKNPKNHLSFGKMGCFWKGSLKGCLRSVIHTSCGLLKTQFYGVFSKAQFCREKGVS